MNDFHIRGCWGREMNEHKQLPCGCIRGIFHCKEAVNLWELYSFHYKNGNYKKAKLYRKKYEEHFKKED